MNAPASHPTEVNADQRQHRSPGGVYLFVSIDMVNSTEFKNNEPRWPFVIHHFYESVVNEMKRVCPRFNVWKYIGDEVTFWRHTHGEDKLALLIRDTYAALQLISQALDAIEDDHGIRTRNVIGAKATMWVASADFVKGAGINRDLNASYRHFNRIIEEDHLVSVLTHEHQRELKTYDFIGPDIDIGFRISHFAQRGFVLLSAGLAYLVLRQSDPADAVDQHMKIVTYHALKGVWGGRRYPIIWYTDDWSNVREKFYYDDPLENPLIAEICRGHFHEVAPVASILRETNRIDTMIPADELLRRLASND
jgi:hypothetical protein